MSVVRIVLILCALLPLTGNTVFIWVYISSGSLYFSTLGEQNIFTNYILLISVWNTYTIYIFLHKFKLLFWQYGKSYAMGHLQMKLRKYGSMTTTYIQKKHNQFILFIFKKNSVRFVSYIYMYVHTHMYTHFLYIWKFKSKQN